MRRDTAVRYRTHNQVGFLHVSFIDTQSRPFLGRAKCSDTQCGPQLG
jgi:hypothetical protein